MSVSERARRIYCERIAPALDPQDEGKLIGVEVSEGRFVLGQTSVEVLRRIRESPQGEWFIMRVGGKPAFFVGGRFSR